MKCKCCEEREYDTKCKYSCCSYCHKTLGDKCHILADSNSVNILKGIILGEPQT
jgi:hypothetical protein